LKLPFVGNGLFPRLELFREDQMNGPPLASVGTQFTAIVLGDSFLQVIGVADIL